MSLKLGVLDFATHPVSFVFHPQLNCLERLALQQSSLKLNPNTFLDMFMANNGNNRTGWKNDRYDELIREGNRQTEPKKREALLQQAELILIRDELPIAPLYFYSGVNFFDPKRIEGIHFNLLDEHPVYLIRKRAAK